MVALNEKSYSENREALAPESFCMVDKHRVANCAGMTVSWLNNSDSAKAKKLRQIGVKYGESHNSAIRYPLHKVIAICLEQESSVEATRESLALH